MEFQNPYAWILGVAALLAWTVGYFRPFKKVELYLPRSTGVKRKLFSRFVIYVIGSLSVISLTIALMGPREPLGFEETTVDVSDIYLVFDVSRSMLAEDIPPNRLEAAKATMAEYVNMSPMARLGIVMFSEKVFTLIPLTLDHDLVKSAIDEISIGFLGSGTNIGDGLALAIGRLNQSTAKSKVIILLTDGVNNVGSMTPIQAAEIAKSKGIRIYGIGFGGDEDARIPIPGTYMGRRRYQTIPGGSIDEETLRVISTMTGGRHWMAQEAESLLQVFREIERLERSEVETNARVIYREQYFSYYLWGVLLLLLTELSRRYWLREEI